MSAERAALIRLLWRSVADHDSCSCVRAGLTGRIIDRCDLCEAWKALGLRGRWSVRKAATELPRAAARGAAAPREPDGL